ncbi:transposase [Glutamicibacter sp. NPDC087344]|uniref:transposase n=1 Tax=Glutamicibacter sp. NPDC087344 TaxID=3363994 RepID=UPI00380AB49A
MTNQRHPDMVVLDLRHRARARCEDRILNAKDTGLRNLPCQQWAKHEWWTRLAFLAGQVTAWMQLLCLQAHQAAKWEPKKLRARLYAIAAKAVNHALRVKISFDSTAHQTGSLHRARIRPPSLREETRTMSRSGAGIRLRT